MPSTTSFKRGDIILVPFPFTDLSSAKQRPALVISSDVLNSRSDDVLVAAISSQIPDRLTAEDFMIPLPDLAACGLPKPSVVKMAKLAALHRQIVIKRIGSMPEPTLGRILSQIRTLF
jgi:mRNA interferase MazF